MVVILLSGGVDSLTLAHVAAEAGRLGACLFVDYGQPAAEQERAAAGRGAAELGCEFHACDLPLLGVAAMETGTGTAGPRVVPGRNLALSALALNLAATAGAAEVWIGCTRDDAAAYSDCRAEWVGGIDLVQRQAGGPRLVAPFQWRTRAEVCKVARRLGVAGAWSCYQPAGDGRPCGTCDSCKQETP